MANKKIAFSLSFEGGDKLVKELSSVDIELAKISKALRQSKKDALIFAEGTKEEIEALEKTGKTLKSTEEEYSKYRAEQLNLQNSGKSLRKELREQQKAFDLLNNNVKPTSLIGLRAEYGKLRKEIDLLSRDERKLAKNKALIEKADAIKKEINSMGEEVSDFRSNVGGYFQALEKYFGKDNKIGGLLKNSIGQIEGINLGGITKSLTGVGGVAGIAVAGLAAVGKYTYDVTLEFEKLRHEVTTTTGAVGKDLSDLTAGVSSISEVFEKDFNEVLRTTNALSGNFGISYQESLDIVRESMILLGGEQSNILEDLNEFSTFANKAGYSASEFAATLIELQQAGIYGNKGIDAFKEFTNRITEQTESTKTALTDAFGEEFTSNLFENINNGSVTVKESLKTVSVAMKKSQLTAKQNQQIYADVFGGPGEDAGNKMIDVFSRSSAELKDLANNSDAYAQRLRQLTDATDFLKTEQNALSEQLAGLGTSFEGLTNQAKGYGTQFLNYIIRETRVAYTAVTENLNSIEARTKLSITDQLALEKLTERQEKQAEYRRQQAAAGNLSLKDLQVEQSKVKKELYGIADKSSEEYSKKMKDYVAITEQVAKATKKFNDNVKRTKNSFKELAQEGSIEKLSKKVSDLNKELKKSTPANALKVIENLNAAKLDLSQAKEELQSLKDAFQRDNIDKLPIAEQVKYYKERISVKKELDIEYAKTKVQDAAATEFEISQIELKANRDSLKEDLKLMKDGSKEKLKTLQKIANIEYKEQENVNIEKLRIEKDLIDKTVLLNEKLLDAGIGREVDYQERLSQLKLNGEIAFLQKRLELEKLSDKDRLALEVELQRKRKAVEPINNSLALNFDTNNQQAENNLNADLLSSIPTFDVNDVKGSKQALEEFEQYKTEKQLEYQIERDQRLRELKLANGEDVFDIDRQIAERQLQLEQEKNKEIIDLAEERAARQEQIQLDLINSSFDVLSEITTSLPDLLNGSADDAEKAQKKIISSLIDLVEQFAIAKAAAYALASVDSAATGGVSGVIKGAILTGLIKAAFAGVKALVLEKGGIPNEMIEQYGQGGHTFKRGKNGLQVGNSHSRSGIKIEVEGGESIINKRSTARYKGLLSALNVKGGGRAFDENTGAWLSWLESLEIPKFELGGLTSSNFDLPQLYLSGTTTQSGISRDEIELIVSEVVQQQTNVLAPIVSNISKEVQKGLDKGNRLAEREQSALINSEI